MLHVEGSSVTELFLAAVQGVLVHGAAVAPRGQCTLEVTPSYFKLTEPRARVLDASCGRVVNPAFAAAEAVWILAGSDDPWIYQYNDRLRRFSEEGRLRGAYGPRLRSWQGVDQLDLVRRQLLSDESSRRATLCLFDPARDLAGGRDVPCTLTHQFLVRDGRLHLHTTMRSQDLWLGFPYDVFTATLLQELVAFWCGFEVGDYHHHVCSLHLYEQHLEAAAHVTAVTSTALQSCLIACDLPWEKLDPVLGRLLAGEPVDAPGWSSLSGVLRSYPLWKRGLRAEARALATATAGPLARGLERWYDQLEASPAALPRLPAPPVAAAAGSRL